MTVKQLIAELSKLDGAAEVVVADDDSEYDVVIGDGVDEDGRPVVVIDLTADCCRD